MQVPENDKHSYNMDAEESVYDLIKPEIIEIGRGKRYKSINNPRTPASYSTFGPKSTINICNAGGSNQGIEKYMRNHGTMGKPRRHYSADTRGFLKRNPRGLPNPGEYVRRSITKADISTDVPKHDLWSSTNFVSLNKVNAMLQNPPMVKEEARLHKEFAKIPKYLARVKADVEKEYDYCQALEAQSRETEQGKMSNLKLLPKEECEALIAGLKEKWNAVNKEYQKSTHLVKLDTVGKIRRKEEAEATLIQIENDISQLSSERVYVDSSK